MGGIFVGGIFVGGIFVGGIFVGGIFLELLWTPLTIKQNVKIISINKMFIKKFNKFQLKV